MLPAMKRILSVSVLAGLVLLGACGGGEELPLGTPLSPALNTWSWVDFPDSYCDDGTNTGIAINQGASNNLVVFFTGGGACWDYLTCYGLNTAAHGPFGKTEFESMSIQNMAGTLFDRAAADNPFRDWSYVFIPYCTGDVHAGDAIAEYTDGTNVKMHHHKGHANAQAFVKRIAATWEKPTKLVVTGASAGGFGSAFNYDLFRKYWPKSKTEKVYLLDDSGPPLVGDAIPGDYRRQWYENWNMGVVLDDLCGAACQSDFSKMVPALAKKYPDDRMGLLSSLEDQVIRTYFQLSPQSFSMELQKMATTVIDPIDHFKYFFVAGETHTMEGELPAFSQMGVTVSAWITQQISDDPSWKSLKP